METGEFQCRQGIRNEAMIFRKQKRSTEALIGEKLQRT
jgi:hypothetical protein